MNNTRRILSSILTVIFLLALASPASAGWGRKGYRITCHAKPNGETVSWTEKAYGRAQAHAVGAVGCQAKTGNPSHSVKKL